MNRLDSNDDVKASVALIGIDQVVDFLGDLFERRGGEAYLGESVTMAEHMLQAAAVVEARGYDDFVVAAALLHDIGHFVGASGEFTMDDTEDRHHEVSGAAFVAQYFPRSMAECVAQHVAAKRYLCATRSSYFGALSPASVHSLSLQGGPMSEAEIELFESSPWHHAVVAVREADDGGKRIGVPAPTFRHFEYGLRALLDRIGARS